MNFNKLLDRLRNEPEWVVLVVLLLLIGLGGGVFYYYQYQENVREANTQFRRAMTVFNRASQTGDYERSMRVMRQYLNNFPDASNADKARFFLGKGYYETGQYVPAIQAFRRLRSNHPNSFFADSALLHIAYSNIERGKFDQARQALRRVTERAKDEPLWVEAQWQLALLEYRLGRNKRANSILTTLLESDRQLETYWRNWARRLKNRLSAQS